VRLKKTEELEGPKVSIEMNIPPLLLFLSPRQLHLLSELASGLICPDTEDHSNVLTKCVGKPMSYSDYERIEKDLQQQWTNPLYMHPYAIPGGHGWATGTLDGSDIEENFTPVGVGHAGDFFESAISETSTMDSSMSSSITSASTDMSRARKRMSRIDRDPTAEISRFEIHLTTLAVVLLHEDLLIESSEKPGCLAPSSVTHMQNTVSNFFSNCSEILSSNDFKSLNAAIDKACHLNHLRLLAFPLHLEGDEKTTSTAFSISGYLEASNFELSECLYDPNKRIVEHIPIITCSDIVPVNLENFTAKPSLKLIFKHLQKTTENLFKSGPKTDLFFLLNKCTVELDVTIVDRITALLNPQPICVVNKIHAVNSQNVKDSVLDINVTSPMVSLKLRFPIPDFRPPHDKDKKPWWERHVETDFLSMNLSTATFETSFDTRKTVQEYVVHCKSVAMFYHENANADPLPIAKAGLEEAPLSYLRDIATECRLNIKFFPPKNTEETQLFQDPISTSVAGDMVQEQESTSQPFTSKRVIYESDTPHHEKQKPEYKSLLVPGNKTEIQNFIKRATESTRIYVDISLPLLSMQLKDKGLYETIYNRVNNGLLLWEPSAPKPSTPVYDVHYSPFRNFDTEDPEIYRLCQSGIQHSSGSETDEESTNMFFSTVGSKMKVSQKPTLSEKNSESYLVFDIKINRGLLTMFPYVKDSTGKNNIPNQEGEFLFNVEDATIFIVNGHLGDPDLGYVCMEFRNAQLYHCDVKSTPSHTPPLKDIGATPGKHLHPTIYRSEKGMATAHKNRGGTREMVTVCIKIQASHETHHVKNISISAGFDKVTLRHKMCNEPNSWVSQLIDFFNVKDVAILGYQPKEVLTEISLHFWDSAIDYRPYYSPVRAVVTLGSFSITSHLSAEIDSSTLRFIAEDCILFLCQKTLKKKGVPYSGPIDLRREYVKVIEFGLFEFCLKMSDKKNTKTPHFDLRASNDLIHICTCTDSAKALTHLINYFANNGDLTPPESTASGSVNSSPRHPPKQELISVEPQEVTNVSESQHQEINNLIEDALEDVDDNTVPQAKSYETDGAKMFYFPDEKHPPNDPGKPLPQVTTELGQAFRPNLAESDEDFCFIDEEPGFNIFPKNGVPEIKWLTDEPVRIVENHFGVPSEKRDPLKTPTTFPVPTKKYTLCEMSILWSMYGGNDFGPAKAETKKMVNFSDANFNDTVTFSKLRKEQVVMGSDNKRDKRDHGGPNRNHDVHVKVRLNKIRFQHDVFSETSSIASRQVLMVSEIEISDRLSNSDRNKLLYQYVSKDMPKRSNTSMVLVKLLHVRPDPRLRRQECCLKISLLPLTLNVDQDAFQFLMSFFSELSSEMKDDDLPVISSKHNTPVHQPPVMTVNTDNEEQMKEEAKKIVDENLLILLEDNKFEEKPAEESPQTSTAGDEDGPIYFRKVIFSPDVPIRLYYQAKKVEFQTYGPIQGLIMGLASLNCSELRLKRISYRHGLLGFDKLITFLAREWINDIKKNQIPNLLVGVGPIYSFVQIFQGIRDLFVLPFEQYKKDGRFLRGLHRGANSFTTSTALAALELTTRFLQLIQLTAETAFDMLTPGPSVRINPRTKGRRKRYNHPKDIREGVTTAYKLVKKGIEETAENIVQVASHEHEQKGYSGAVGGVIRQIPPTIIKPIIIASEATNNVLSGVRCQLVPDARKEAQERWRSADTYDSLG
jgi:autophagy-related protein 2